MLGALCNWLLQPQRRQQVVNRLIVHIDTFEGHHALRTLLDYLLNDLVFRTVSWIFDICATYHQPLAKKFQLPRSLKASRLCVHAAGDFFDWPSLRDNAYLRDNLIHLRFEDMRHHNVPSYTFFKSLRKLEIIVRGASQYESLSLTEHHPNIKELHVEDMANDLDDKKSLGDLSHIEVLGAFGVVIDFETTNLASLKELHIGTETLANLHYIPDSLKVLTLNSCWEYDVPSVEIRREAELPVHPSTLFPKLPNLRVLKIHNCNSKSLSEIFNEGYLKNSMPALEELRLYDTSINAAALFDFIHTHSKLKVVSVAIPDDECSYRATEMTLNKAGISTTREHNTEFPEPRAIWY